MASPEFEPLPDTQSDQEPTPYESSLIIDAMGVHDDAWWALWMGDDWTQHDVLRVLRAGHEAGRCSVLQAPVRVWREGDPPPESKVVTIDNQCMVGEWDPETSDGWRRYVATYGPLIEVTNDFGAALAADAARRAGQAGSWI